MQKTVGEFTVATITADQAEAVQIDAQQFDTTAKKIHAINLRLVMASLNAAGGQYTVEQVGAMPYYQTFLPLLEAANQVNGFEVGKSGEADAGATPAA